MDPLFFSLRRQSRVTVDRPNELCNADYLIHLLNSVKARGTTTMAWRRGKETTVVIQLMVLLIVWLGVAISGRNGETLPRAGARSIVSLIPRHKVRFPRAREVSQNCPQLTLRNEQFNSLGRSRLRRRLSFRNGDWDYAEAGAAPVIPFLKSNDSALPAKLQLSSFWVTDMAQDRKQVRELSGTLWLSIVDAPLLPRSHFVHEPQFQMFPGLSLLSIGVEGTYQQAENEDVVCMLGCTYLPSPDNGLDFSNIQNATQNKKLDKQCNILVRLHYPLTFNLTSRVIRGTIQSLAAKGDPYYFPPISISSQIGPSDVYEPAGTDFLGFKAACPSVTGAPNALTTFASFPARADDFCMMASNYISWGSVLDIEPTWNCNQTSLSVSYCRKIGPFDTFDKHSAFYVDYNSSRAQILVQNYHYSCFDTSTESPDVPMTFVLRLVPADEALELAQDRSALDGQTIVAEGYWTNQTLCMVGCKLNDETGQADACNSRISISIPIHLSITQRDVFKGSIASLLPPDHPDSFFPLTFHVKLSYTLNLPLQLSSALRYNYSILDQAGALLTRHEPQSNKRVTWFKYPSLAGEAENQYQRLAADLQFHDGLKLKTQQQQYVYLDFYVVAIDQYLPFVWSGFTQVETERLNGSFASPIPRNETIVTETNPKWTHRRREARKYLNCSATMVFTGVANTVREAPKSLTIYGEGLYNPQNGKLYMIGCRSVHASWQQMFGSTFDLVDGMDCEIEVVMEYPTTTAAWLLSPVVKVKVHSRRPVDDMFHFGDIDTETDAVLFRGERQSILSRKSIEGALSILTLSLMLACIVSQLIYTGNHADSAPYVSLVMLGVQALGYAIPLITGAESLLVRKFDYRKFNFFQETGSIQLIVYADKLMTLVALLVLLRIFEKVRKERGSRLDKSPREGIVFVTCMIIHAVGFASVMGFHYWNLSSGLGGSSAGTGVIGRLDVQEVRDTTSPWARRLALAKHVSREYVGLIDDLFLLPQAIAFGLWEISGQPLRLSFFAGLTLLQIVPHVYDHLREHTIVLSVDLPLYANPELDFYTNLGNFLIPAVALLLAVVVFCQQRWNGILRFKPKFRYRRLGEKASETELVTTNGRSHLPPIPEDGE